MQDNILDNKRVARNTVALYFRTIITLCISLYTSRAILNILGVDDYGIYNVVGGFVSMFSIISSTLVSATQRYLNFELGKLNDNHSREVFNSAIVIHVVLDVVLVLLFETIGLWFLNAKLNIPYDRMYASNWLFQFSIITFILNILRSPFEASIVAHERMTVFAYTNIFESVLKLVFIYILLLPFGIDHLILYGFLMLLVTIVVFLIYYVYCKRNFDEVQFAIVKDKSYYKGMLSFAGFNFIGASSTVFAGQGVNMLLNMFFGVAVNAARGITVQVQTAISKFVNDFTTALNPQITKSYAQGNIPNMMNLIYKGSKISYLLFLFFAVPIIVQTPYILKLWLGIVPEYAVIFVRLSLIDALINTVAGPISMGAISTGDIKKLSIWIGVIRFSVFPLSYFAFKLGCTPEVSFLILIGSDFILFFVRLFISCSLIGVKEMPYIQNVVYKIVPTTILSFGFAVGLNQITNIDNFIYLIGYTILVCLITVLLSLFLAFSKAERVSIKSMLGSRMSRR